MAATRVLSSFNRIIVSKHNFSTSSFLCNTWRKSQGLEEIPNKYGPLTSLPDFSYVDGRPVPLSLRQYMKRKYQEKLCERIVELNHEMDVGLENYYKKKEQMKQERERILKSKLKPKGKHINL